jgi:hypothetical protein
MKIEILRVSNLIVCHNGDAQSFLSSLSRYITRRKLELNYIHLLQMSSAVIRWICSILRKVFVEHFLQQTFHLRLSKKCPFNSRYIYLTSFLVVYIHLMKKQLSGERNSSVQYSHVNQYAWCFPTVEHHLSS